MRTPIRNRVLDLDLLRVFVLVVQSGSFSSAARALSRTQSAVSMQIRRLEEQLGCTLVYRRRTGAQPTPEGSSLLQVAGPMLAMNDRVFEQLNASVVSGHVRIGAIEHYATAVLPELVARFCKLYPDVLVEIHTGSHTLMQTQLRSHYDLVIGMSEPGSAIGTTLTTARVVWAVSPKHEAHKRTPLPLALGIDGTLFRRWAIQALDAAGVRWRMTYCSSSVGALEASVKAGLAVGIFNEHTISRRLRILGAKDGLPALPRAAIWIVHAEGSNSRATTLLHDFLVEAIRGRPRR
jgi:DNA-binding transcriptional LysR family regulator